MTAAAGLLPALPPPGRAALLLDMDGTLLDIAPAPDKVVVPEGLPETLHRVRALLGDALAVVSGRPIGQLEALLGDAPFALAGEHGGALRRRPAAEVERVPLPAPPPEWLEAAAGIAAAHPGVLLETKERGFVLHYRAVPDLAPLLHEAVRALVGSSTAFTLLAAKMAWEVKPSGADKGMGVRLLMQEPPFAGRLPVFVGDDVTDLDGIETARAMGGAGMLVAETFGDAAGVRAWLGRVAAAGGWT